MKIKMRVTLMIILTIVEEVGSRKYEYSTVVKMDGRSVHGEGTYSLSLRRNVPMRGIH